MRDENMNCRRIAGRGRKSGKLEWRGGGIEEKFYLKILNDRTVIFRCTGWRKGERVEERRITRGQNPRERREQKKKPALLGAK